jgi:hypothetical protein
METNPTDGETNSKNVVFTKEMKKAIESVIKIQNPKQPMDKICLIWLMGKKQEPLIQRQPKLICFRKVLGQNQEPKLEIVMSENASEFETIVENGTGVWESVIPPPDIATSLYPLLKMNQENEYEIPSRERLWTLYKPQLLLWNRYLESWSNGKSWMVLRTYKDAVIQGYPIVFIKKCQEKWASWIRYYCK